MKNLFAYSSFLLLITLAFVTCQKKDYSTELNPILDKYLEAWNEGDLEILDEITTLDFELRINPDFEAKNSRDLLKEDISNTRMAYPDFLVTVDDRLFVSDTAIVIRWTITGTNTGAGSHPPTGKRANSNGFSIIFFAEGKLTGEWIAYSDLTWVKQLGFTMTPPWIAEE
ncbi:MAG: ester cyclase [Ignavibacteriaceae bacterium]